LKILVTGAAGFIGSHLSEALTGQGHQVVGIDSLTSYYDIGQKRSNLAPLLTNPRFTFIELDLKGSALNEIVEDCDAVYHQAAQPGVRASWSAFHEYIAENVMATQALLEASRAAAIERFVYASSSSVYGNLTQYPATEESPLLPHSPYGVTKLAGENLVRLYGENWGLSTTCLRYFTVYGPRQRPDMAINRLIRSALDGTKFTIYGDGSQVRDFTFVHDVVAANLAALEADLKPGTIMNVAGGGEIVLSDLVDLVAQACDAQPNLDRRPAKAGDVRRTGGDIRLAESLLGWAPDVGLEGGIKEQVAWQRQWLDAPFGALTRVAS
jgi:UDP-glucuronate 4-epimerase